ncbi:MAG: phosphatase PAP2 family protein [Chloroflexia bacterium]|nr:phosphatase PAP2 family protein [Chloroflexia bacterium]
MRKTIVDWPKEILDRSRLPIASRRIVKRRRSSFLGGSIIAFSSFLILLILVRSKRSVEADLVATMRIQRIKHPALAKSMGVVSWIGFRPQSLVLPFSIITLAWLSGFRRDARYLVFAWLGSFISFTTKLLIQRPRPSGEGITVAVANLKDTSFPSGHTLHYVSFWGFFSYLLFSKIRGKWLRLGPLAVMGSFIGLIGPSRVYLGHHWLTDVLASYCLGTGYLMGLIGMHRRGEDG